MQISIIIPVYNTGYLLPRCVESVINQTYKNLQIILINDGSTDDSLSICNKYKDIDSRILVIDKDNGGLSDARNTGLNKSSGDYVMFLDSDDYIDLNACQNFVERIGNREPDILTANALRVEDKKIIKIAHDITNSISMLKPSDFLVNELKNETMNMAACFNLYSLEFLNNNNLRFIKGLYHEDEIFTPTAFLAAKSILPTDIVFYNYIIRDNSITKSHDSTKKAKDVLFICHHLDEVYKDINDDNLRNYLYDHMVNFYLNVFQVSKMYKKEYKFYIQKELLKGKGQTRVNKARIVLFRVSPLVYYVINSIRKLFI